MDASSNSSAFEAGKGESNQWMHNKYKKKSMKQNCQVNKWANEKKT